MTLHRSAIRLRYAARTLRSSAGRLRYFFALSRTPHAILDLAAPAVSALLWAGRLPGPRVIVLGVITAFSAYTAVYALNDLVDRRRDAGRAAGCPDPDTDLDAAMQLHPLAQGCISFGSALAWTLFWGLVASVGAYLLNPVCLVLFLVACLLETFYCVLGGITPLRTLIAGVVKSAGPVAAVFAVDPQPTPGRLALFFAWFYLWEIGGQNIPNDWTDIEEDRRFHARTVPVVLGLRRASLISLVALICAMFLNLLVFWLSPLKFGLFLPLLALAANAWLLLRPALRLQERPVRQNAMMLFNRASLYPLANLALVLVGIIL
jgi:4-hydroxybenzoate polyprenyltransferase